MWTFKFKASTCSYLLASQNSEYSSTVEIISSPFIPIEEVHCTTSTSTQYSGTEYAVFENHRTENTKILWSVQVCVNIINYYRLSVHQNSEHFARSTFTLILRTTTFYLDFPMHYLSSIYDQIF